MKNIEKEIRTINVGIDLGTSSTKVIYQIVELAGAGQQNAFIFDFGDNPEIYPPLTLPSYVIVHDEKYYFGLEAYLKMEISEAEFTSFKMCVACLMGITKCKKCNQYQTNSFDRGIFSYKEIEINAYDIMLFYLAYVMGIVCESLNKKYGDHFRLIYSYNVSFPLNYLQKKENNKLLEKLVFWAEDLKDIVHQGIPVKMAADALIKTYNRKSYLPKIEEKCTFVFSETIVTMHSFRVSATHDDGLYAIIDIGAGTTDISFFRLGESKGVDPLFSIYFDQSHNIGGDNFDQTLLDYLMIKFKNEILNFSNFLEVIKSAKQKMSDQNLFIITNFSLEWGLRKFQDICSENYVQLRNAFRETRCCAFKKEQDWKRWENINILIIGGGSKLPYIKDPIYNTDIPHFDWKPTFPDLQLPDNLDIVGSNISKNKLKDIFYYFYTAHGLSYHFDEYERSHYPDTVSNFRPKKIYRNFVDIDDQYSGMPDTTRLE